MAHTDTASAPARSPRIVARSWWLAVLVLMAIPLAGCGQKGPLVLPEDVEPPPGQAPVPQSPAGSGAEDDEDGDGDE